MKPFFASYEAAGVRENHATRQGLFGHFSSNLLLRTRSVSLLVILALMALAGCTTIALQFIVSNRSRLRLEGNFGHSSFGADEARPSSKAYTTAAVLPLAADNSSSFDSSITINSISTTGERSATSLLSVLVPTADGQQYEFQEQGGQITESNPEEDFANPVDITTLLPISANRLEKLVVDRRFEGQETGDLPQLGDVLRSPLLSEGPFGWGTDWITGVSVREVLRGRKKGNGKKDVIEPTRCRLDEEERSFVERVMKRREAASTDTFNRVRFRCGGTRCLREN